MTGVPHAQSLAWPAPAKLNLFLHITGRRGDGYHLLQTVFQFIDIHDLIRFDLTRDGEISAVHQIPGVTAADDLTVRAARLLQSTTGCHQGVRIELTKYLPTGGGVGGGSSDAATTLLVLNRLWQTGLSIEELARLGLQLGADVPIFIHGRACWAEGVGESFQDVELKEPVYLLVYPKVHVSTGQIFTDPELTRDTSPIKIADFLAGHAGNDCEAVVRKQVPAVDEAMRWLDGFAPSRLTGTGACVFAEFDNTDAAQKAMVDVPHDWQSWVTRGHNHSPLHQMLNEVFD